MRNTAQNVKDIGEFLGDPTRWGSTVTFQVLAVAGQDTGYVLGEQAVLMQFSDLRARSVDVMAQYRIDGVKAGLGPFHIEKDGFTGFGLRWNIGVGQSNMQADSAVVYAPDRLSSNYTWSQIVVANHVVEGVLQNTIPIPAASVSLRPVFRVKGADLGDQLLTITTTIIASPRT
jgi:hypothetical protein